jgi:hypothetical protein
MAAKRPVWIMVCETGYGCVILADCSRYLVWSPSHLFVFVQLLSVTSTVIAVTVMGELLTGVHFM